MRIVIRQRDASTLQKDGWSQSQMEDWLAELGDDDQAEPPGDGRIEPGGSDDPWPEALAEAAPRTQADAGEQAPGEAAPTSAAVTTTCRDTVPDLPAITDPPPASPPASPPAAAQRNRPRPLEAAQCSLCGIALPLGLLVPDGSPACADVRWYCKDATSCTKRWTTAHPPD
jgi:hypothetical protein